jgi:hypothetical protein
MVNTLLPIGNKQPIGRTPDSFSSAIQDVSINHRGADVIVSKEFLNRSNIVTVLQQMGCLCRRE